MKEELKSLTTDLSKGKFLGMDVKASEKGRGFEKGADGKPNKDKPKSKIKVFTIKNRDAAAYMEEQYGITPEITKLQKEANNDFAEVGHAALSDVSVKDGTFSEIRVGDICTMKLIPKMSNPIPESDKVSTKFGQLKFTQKTSSLPYLSRENDAHKAIVAKFEKAEANWK